MSLQGLINEQTIIIDDHRRGTNEKKDWDDSSADIHIDKSTKYKIDGKYQNVKIRVPINSENPIKIESKKEEIPIPRSLKKEIQTAFEDKKIRDSFIRDMNKVLINFKSNLSDEVKAQEALERVAKHFGLKWDKKKVAQYRNDALFSYTQLYKSETDKQYYIMIHTEAIELSNIDENNKDRFKWK